MVGGAIFTAKNDGHSQVVVMRPNGWQSHVRRQKTSTKADTTLQTPPVGENDRI